MQVVVENLLIINIFIDITIENNEICFTEYIPICVGGSLRLGP